MSDENMANDDMPLVEQHAEGSAVEMPVFEKTTEVSPVDGMERLHTPAGFVSASKEKRPSLTPSESPDGDVPILDVSKGGIFSDAALMEKHFPSVTNILRNAKETTDLTTKEVNELSKYALAKAGYPGPLLTEIHGMLDNQLHHPDGGTFGPMLSEPVMDDDDEFTEADLAGLEVQIEGGGTVVYPLTNSGFRLKIKPIGVTGEVKLEESILHRIGECGRSTIGGGVLALDAIIIDLLIDAIVKNVVDHNIKDVEIDDYATIRSLISHKDIRPLIAVMNGIMNLDGYDYNVPCDNCKEGVRRMNLNVLRSMHYDHGRLSREQLDQLKVPISGAISKKSIRKYQESFFGHAMTHEFDVKKFKCRIHMRHGSVDDKINSYRTLFSYLEDLAREALTNKGKATREEIDAKCTELLRRMWHINYLPMIHKIEMIMPKGKKTKVATKPLSILTLLKSIASSDSDFELANILTKFSYDNVVQFAVHVPKCDVCSHEPDEMRGYDPVIDFFIRRMSSALSASIVQEVMIQS